MTTLLWGRFVFGMFNRDVLRDPIGGFYRLDTDLSLERLPLPPEQADAVCHPRLGFVEDARQKVRKAKEGLTPYFT